MGAILLFSSNNKIEVSAVSPSPTKAGLLSFIKKKEEPVRSPISGEECENVSRRPIAIMMPSDPETRPLSGISQADLVIEMPVAPNGVTRFMAVFQCETPTEIGSIRSARDDFIPLAASFNSIYAHWGGEHDALEKLNRRVLDNVDALKYEGSIFYRKRGIARPHNGFTTLARITEKARELGYDLTRNFSGYPHLEEAPSKNLSTLVNQVSIGYPVPYNVNWQYNPADNTYTRSRGGRLELDRLTQQPVKAAVIVKMRTTARWLRDQYISVNTKGQGTAEIYQNETVTTAVWKKDPAKLDSKLTFYDQQGKEIKFMPGKIWIEIITNSI